MTPPGVMIAVWIAGGSALGGLLRYWATGLAARVAGDGFPWGTLLVNATGSFLIGLLAAVAADDRLAVGAETRQFLMIGVLGGFTTFSSFSLDTLALFQEGEWIRAGANVLGSVLLCLAGVWLGHALGGLATR